VATLVLASNAGFGSEIHLMLRSVATPLIGSLATYYTTRASARILERLLYVDRSHPACEAAQSSTPVSSTRSGALFKGVGHLLQVERAEEFAELTVDFLRSQAVA